MNTPGSEKPVEETDGTSRRDELLSIVRGLRFRLETARLAGWHVPLGSPSSRPVKLLSSAGSPEGGGGPEAREGSPPAAPPSATGNSAEERVRRQGLLDALDRQVRECRECALCEQRNRTVFGVGDPCARLVFIGEGPGYDEDRLGEPFVGRAGHLLDDMLAAMGLRRSQVYIANIVKCRPPGNRVPAPREVIACLPYLRQQLEIIRPELICTLGNTPTRTLLQTSAPISRIRGQLRELEGIPVLPTFHPAYLLRNPRDKRLAWEDLKKVMARLGLPLPPPRRTRRRSGRQS